MWAIVAYVFWNIVVPAAIAYGISYLLTKDQKSEGAGKQRINLPTATEGRPFPVLFGCRMIRGLNAISPFLYRYTFFRVYQDEKAANIYYATFHLGVCLCLDGVKQIWGDKVVCWPTKFDPDTYAADSQTTATINAYDLWGDWVYGGQGGMAGEITILYGASNQGLDPYLEYKLGSSQPYYRGFVSMVFGTGDTKRFYIGVAPTLRPIEVLGKRTDQFNDRTTMWYLAKAAIGSLNDMNPAHMNYEWITSPLIGRGIDTTLIGDTFTTTADTLYTEGFGLSCVWDYAPDKIDAMIQQVEQIVDGKVYFDYETGKYEFGLNRPDYTPANLTTYDESDFWIEAASYLSPDRIPSKVIVYWEHRQYEGQRIAYDDDIALLARQGGVPNVVEYDYSAFVVDGDLANTIAARQQYAFSSMPKKFTLRCLRTMSALNETDVFKISYPALNISSMVVRLVSIDRGSLSDGECVIECIEDVFGQSYTVYGTPPEPAIDPAELEMNIAVENIGLTDYANVSVEWGINVNDSVGVSDYADITII